MEGEGSEVSEFVPVCREWLLQQLTCRDRVNARVYEDVERVAHEYPRIASPGLAPRERLRRTRSALDNAATYALREVDAAAMDRDLASALGLPVEDLVGTQ